MIRFFSQKLYDWASDRRFSEIFVGSVWAVAARALSGGLALLFSILVARYYGAEAVGIVGVISSLVMFAAIFALLGTNISALRLIPEHMANHSATSALRVYRKILGMVAGLSLLAAVVIFAGADILAVKVFSKPHLGVFFSLAALFVVARALMELNTNALRGLKHIRAFAFMQLLPHLFALLLLLVMIRLAVGAGGPVYALLASWLITGLAGILIIVWIFAQKRIDGDAVKDVPLKRIMTLSLPMFMANAAGLFIGQVGVLMLGMFRDEAEVGYYFIALKLATLTGFALKAVNTMASPRFAELYHSGKTQELFHIARKSTRLIFWTSAPVLLFLILLGYPFLRVAFGDVFVAAYPALVLLALGKFASAISGSTGAFMSMTGHQSVFQNIMIVTLGLNIAMNLLFIPPLGILGAALSAMLSQAFWNFSVLLFIKKKFGRSIGYFPFL